MKKILTFLFILTTLLCTAQNIEMEKAFGGYKYSQGGKQLTMGELVNTMEANPDAFKLIKKARTSNTFATILGGAGGALVGFPLGQALGGGDPNWTLAGIGAGLIVIGIPISIQANKKAKQAVDIYNSSLESTSFNRYVPEYQLIATVNGIGLSVVF